MADLVEYDSMRGQIEPAENIQAAKEIVDRAAGFEEYCRRARDDEAFRRVCEIRLRAERKGGQLLQGMEKHPPGPAPKDRSPDTTGPPTLRELGITKDQSSKWQQLAGIPDEDFEADLASLAVPNTTALLKQHKARQELPEDPKDDTERGARPSEAGDRQEAGSGPDTPEDTQEPPEGAAS